VSPASPFENRLRKNARHLRRWAKVEHVTAYRLYDRDIPEWPFAVDWYDGRVQLIEYPNRRALKTGEAQAQRVLAEQAVQDALELPAERLYVKTRRPKVWGKEQYEALGTPEPFVVREHGLLFEVDLAGHLDTGLFLDHRTTRSQVRAQAAGKRFLNLFAYTGAFTVHAAAGGAVSTTSVDLSNTYLDWAERNLELNRLGGPQHALVRADALDWLQVASEGTERWDLVVLDPPSFSTSKRMSRSFDVQRDQVRLLERTGSLLAPGGTLYFSTNFQGFELKADQLRGLHFTELTPRSLPPDFHRQDVHRCWRVRVA
jgi:23S rRNA (cytosine1962-C5)-methyltransferase